VGVDGGFEAAVAEVRALPSDADEVPDRVLATRMDQLVRLRAMVDAALVEQLAAFDARAAARYDGQTSTRAWLRSRLRLGGQAAQLLLVARQLDRLPQVAKAFAAGEITLEHAAAVAALAVAVGAEQVAGYEQILLDLARVAAPAQLRMACDHVRQLLDPDGDADHAARLRSRRHLAAGRTVDGMVHLQGLLDPASGDVVLTALQAALPVPAADEERTTAQRRADALVDVCAGWLASGDAPASGGVRPQVQVTVGLDALRDARSRGCTHRDRLGDVPVLADGQPVPASVARRIACDAGIIPVVLGSGSEPLDIGRQSRVVPAGLRRALHLRDGGCRFAGCDRPTGWCDAHHLRHWADGGTTELENLLLVCAHHHTLIHDRWRVVGTPGGALSFRRPDGTRLELTSEPSGQPPTRGP
jgi:hypothetical protein